MPLGSDAVALKARPLRVQHTLMLTKRRREVGAAEFFDLRFQQSPYQSAAALDGGDACLFGTLRPNLEKNWCLEKELRK